MAKSVILYFTESGCIRTQRALPDCNSNFVTGAVSVHNKNYGYPSTSDEGYFFSETVDNYEFYHLEFTIPECFIEFRGYHRDWQSVYYVIVFFLTARLYRMCIMSNLMKTADICPFLG